MSIPPDAPDVTPALPSRLYAIVDEETATAAGWTVIDLAAAYLDAGVRLVQLRAKHASSRDVLRWTDAIASRMRSYEGARLVINDRVDVALAAGVPSVHVGQDDLPAAAARALVGPHGLVGLSTHSPQQIADACRAPVDYIAVGPVYETSSKDSGYTARGLALVRAAADAAEARSPRVPVVAIGGITVDRCPEVTGAGAFAVAVIGGLLGSEGPAACVRRYLQALGED